MGGPGGLWSALDADLYRDDLLLTSPWIKWSRVCLIFVGICYCALGIVFSPVIFLDPEVPLLFQLAIVAMLLVVGVGVGVVNFLAAWGLGRGARWAWITTIILGATYAPSGCLPFGVLLLIAMLRADVRDIYLAK